VCDAFVTLLYAEVESVVASFMSAVEGDPQFKLDKIGAQLLAMKGGQVGLMYPRLYIMIN
jgi:hypothetical protein